MNTDKIYAEHLANEYAPKDTSKVVALRKLDARAKLPATVFTYAFGIAAALVTGVACVCCPMEVIHGSSRPPLFFRRAPLRLQFLQQQPGNGGKHLVFFPDDIHFGFQRRLQGPKAQVAVRSGVHKAIKRQHISQPLPHKNRAVIREIDRAGKVQRIRLFPAPAGNVELHALRGKG